MLRLHSVLRAGSVYVTQEGDKFRLVTDIPGLEAEAFYAEPHKIDAVLTGLASRSKVLSVDTPPTNKAEVATPTQTEVLTKQRLGQTQYRAGLMELWGGACAVTGVDIPELLRASHAKPWSEATDRERLDPYNGFLLEARFDRLFDQGLISFDDKGCIMISPRLDAEHCKLLGITPELKLRMIRPEHLPYLLWHREWIFKD